MLSTSYVTNFATGEHDVLQLDAGITALVVKGSSAGYVEIIFKPKKSDSTLGFC